ncbi:DUF1569 domain-containing protein [Spirosoma radiotolerans]|uniref:DUF1569 domain-containing protein n=1 Tax=Spirosoma radiotolerans TaxID=1379870 RepID=A0A0E3ZVZ8_9BACT|nr:DUF1569 domain-containing protein [Spirosoma radiotolerans]AKD55429.1 hypothetical protein SD10_11455 [Spirosoma radiotolerans]
MKRSIVNQELLYSTVAIVKYFPKAFFLPQVDGNKFYEKEMQDELKQRIKTITADSKRVWGTMSAAQMLHHLSLSLGGVLGFFDLPDESYWLSRTLFKWILVDFFPEQPRGLRMPLNFVIPHEQWFDLNTEKELLLTILEKAWKTPTESWSAHPLLGKLTRWQWGKLVQIHFDYHLRQFSA